MKGWNRPRKKKLNKRKGEIPRKVKQRVEKGLQTYVKAVEDFTDTWRSFGNAFNRIKKFRHTTTKKEEKIIKLFFEKSTKIIIEGRKANALISREGLLLHPEYKPKVLAILKGIMNARRFQIDSSINIRPAWEAIERQKT